VGVRIFSIALSRTISLALLCHIIELLRFSSKLTSTATSARTDEVALFLLLLEAGGMFGWKKLGC